MPRSRQSQLAVFKNGRDSAHEVFEHPVCNAKRQIMRMWKKRPPLKIHPRTENQRVLLDTIRSPDYDIVFTPGPPGTGKTFLATTYGLTQVLDGHYDRLIIVRPAVEAGESIGYLPGDIDDKMTPFVRPVLDVVCEHIEESNHHMFLSSGIVEICPVAFAKGRTFKGCFIVVDEAQDLDDKQMRMILSRLGERSRMIVCGDLKQSDLDSKKTNGFLQALDALIDVECFGVARLTKHDIQRHRAVKNLIENWPGEM